MKSKKSVSSIPAVLKLVSEDVEQILTKIAFNSALAGVVIRER